MASNTAEPTQAELSLARKMANMGKTAAEINEACMWGMRVKSVPGRLKKYGIALKGNRKAHRGVETNFSSRGIAVDFSEYRPQRRGAE